MVQNNITKRTTTDEEAFRPGIVAMAAAAHVEPAVYARWVREAAATAPPLTHDQRARLRVLLRPTV